MGYLLDIAPKDLEKVLYFASYIITTVDKEAREEDADDLRDELAADLEELDAERARQIEEPKAFGGLRARGRRLRRGRRDERLTPEEVDDGNRRSSTRSTTSAEAAPHRRLRRLHEALKPSSSSPMSRSSAR